jgi:hypothetical protein
MAEAFTKVVRFEGIRGISSPGMLSIFRERRSWRCVGRRREEPAARRRATNGPFSPGRFFLSRELLPLPRQNPRSLSPHFIVSRVSSFTTWVTACDGSPCGWLRRGVTVTGFGIRQNHASPQLKDDCSKAKSNLLARPPMRKAKCQLFLGTTSRGACVAPKCEPDRLPSWSGPKGHEVTWSPSAPAVSFEPFRSLRVAIDAESRRNRAPKLEA